MTRSHASASFSCWTHGRRVHTPLLRLAVVWNVPVACNRASADYMISSPLLDSVPGGAGVIPAPVSAA